VWEGGRLLRGLLGSLFRVLLERGGRMLRILGWRFCLRLPAIRQDRSFTIGRKRGDVKKAYDVDKEESESKEGNEYVPRLPRDQLAYQ
jgi:hypothetical protein